MKNFFRKYGFFRLMTTVLFFLIFFLFLGVMLLPLSGSWEIANLFTVFDYLSLASDRIFPRILEVLFFAGLVPLGFSCFDLFKKKNLGNRIGAFYFALEAIVFYIFQATFSILQVSAIVLASLALFLSMVAFVFSFLDKAREEKDKNPEVIPPSQSGSVRGILFVLIAGLVVIFFGCLFIPLFQATRSSGTVFNCVFFDVLLGRSTNTENNIYFLVNVVLFLTALWWFLSLIPCYYSNRKLFVKRSLALQVFLVFLSVEFFLLGYVISYVYALQGLKSSSLSFVLLIPLAILSLIYAIFLGRYQNANPEEKPEEVPLSVKEERQEVFLASEPLLFVLLATFVSLFSLFVKVVVIDFSAQNYTNHLEVGGLQLLQDYASLGSGYQALALGMIVMYLINGSLLLAVLAAYLAKSKFYRPLAKTALLVDTFLLFLFGIAGLYFSIAVAITADNTKDLIAYYLGSTTVQYQYSMQTQTYYLFLIDLVLVSTAFFRKIFEASFPGELPPEEASVKPAEEETPKPEEKKPEEKEAEPEKPLPPFDPCPAFSELDAKIPLFEADFADRKTRDPGKMSLNEWTQFIVDYAKDSRLHLSYSQADIACFFAGLGACRLSILQGMSGTGKTSLPKIVAEAINGVCDIVEVESSWKDKNELLGYYNEFSEKYTPKKFTQALYRAALNPGIVTFIVLDEMNLSRIEYYFSDFLSLMEAEENRREIKLVNIPLFRREENGLVSYKALQEGHTLKVPANVWFVGTANRDESTFVISDKVYDRAYTMNFNKRAPKVRDFSAPIPQRFFSYENLRDLLSEAKNAFAFDAENNPLIKATETLLSPYNISFGNRILKQMEDFVAIYVQCFPGRDVVNEAIETILLSKVVSKLEVKTIENKDELIHAFTELGLLRCADFVSKLSED